MISSLLMSDQLRLGSDGGSAKELARQVFQPSQPIRRQELLVGRVAPLERTLDALSTPGRSPFIYGVRGVGKTSLAQTASYLFNWSGVDPIYISCTPDTSWGGVVTRVARKLMKLPHYRTIRRELTEVKVGPAVAQLIHRIEKTDEYVNRLDSGDAVDLFNTLAPRNDEKMVVIIDELDMASPAFKADLAYFIKQVGDQESRLSFIFAGIAENASELLESHGSASRYIATIELQPLLLGELVEIVTHGFERLGISVPDRLARRIACLSDGFAHFTHLLCLKSAMRVIGQGKGQLDGETFALALGDAIEDSAVFLSDSYRQAVQKYQDKYEPVIWAAADHWELLRSTEHMYDSYLRICDDLRTTPQDRSSFSSLLYQLKQPAHGAILKSDRRSWYQFTQAMMRGYCRIIAASKKVDVGIEYMGSSR